MKMEVEIISKECIKPSSPTPSHLKTHKLSFLDRHAGHGYLPFVLYYPMNYSANITTFERLLILKQSLSETLSRYYPFAGKIKDTCSIDCNDEGIYFVEAIIKIPLNEFLHCPIIPFIKKFLPDEAKWKSVPGDYVAGVQVTTFSCGGFAVGINVSHRIADGVGISSFFKGWAATTNKNTDQKQEALHPKFDGWSIFPINDADPGEASTEHVKNSLEMKLGKYVTKRYVFHASAIAKLKAKAIRSGVQNPTRVDVVTAVFAKSIRASVKARSDKPFLLNFGVNLRKRASPQFSESYMGNFPWMASVECKEDKDVELKSLVCQMKEEISKLNADFVNSLKGDEGWFNYLKAIQHEREIFTNPGDLLLVSGWCNFGFYDVDFGWGKPIWVSFNDIAEKCFFLGAIGFMDTRQRDGIEAWAGLLEEDIANLERDEEFLSLATVDPSALKF